MKCLTVTAAALAISVTVPAVARADGYVAVGVGSGGSVSDGDAFSSDQRLSGRLMIGQRISLLSVEAGVSGYGLEGMSPGTQWDAVALGAGLKLNLPIVLGLEIFGRGGVERTWLEADGAGMADYAGNGTVFGAGLEYGFDLVVTDASLWLDWTRHDADLDADGDAPSRDATTDIWTAGVSVEL
jgi:hypothetical protein